MEGVFVVVVDAAAARWDLLEVSDDVFVFACSIPIGLGTQERFLQIVFVSTILSVKLAMLDIMSRRLRGGGGFVPWDPWVEGAINGAVRSCRLCLR